MHHRGLNRVRKDAGGARIVSMTALPASLGISRFLPVKQPVQCFVSKAIKGLHG